MSKDIKPKQRLGQSLRTRRRRNIVLVVIAVACGAGVYAAYRFTGSTEVDVPVARVRRGDFVISVRTRGEIKSTRSVILTAPQVPNPQIVKLAESGKPVKKGDVVVEFDPVQQEENYIERSTSVRTVDRRGLYMFAQGPEDARAISEEFRSGFSL